VPAAAALDGEDEAMLAAIPEQLDAIAEAIEGFRFRQAAERLIDLGRKANVYFNNKQPWVTRKTDMERTATTLHVCAQVVNALCTGMAPFLPEGAEKLAGILNITLPTGGPDGGADGWNAAKEFLPTGHVLNEPQVLFPKIDPDRITELAELHQSGGAV
jgi:methionyl-tRNA synthetase